jgi:hypothetical protein
MTTSLTIPSTLKATLEPAALAAIEAALAPPLDHRAKTDLDIEVEADGEGTFTVSWKNRAVTAKKGFAKRPLISVRLGRGTWPLLREHLQAAVDGFASAPELRAALHAWRGMQAHEVDAVVAAIAKLAEGAAVNFELKGAGNVIVARGPVDEATRELALRLEVQDLRAILSGRSPRALSVSTSGDRSVATALLTALGPVLALFRP